MPTLDTLFSLAPELLSQLIRVESYSRQEEQSAAILYDFLRKEKLEPQSQGHNIWIKNRYFDPKKPSILLNSHHDTVKICQGWIEDPLGAKIKDGKIFGLGSNDAGGALVSLLMVFLYFNESQELPYNLIWAGSAEEEISGAQGIAKLIPELGPISLAIVGEPTQMQMAIAERGLMVVDGVCKGQAGHAAREEGINAIYEFQSDLDWLRHYQYPKVSDLLGPVKMSLTQMQAGTQHNVVPDTCTFVIDVRVNELYSNTEVFEMMQSNMRSEIKARSFRLNSSRLDPKHPVIERGLKLGLKSFGSPTLSDQALMPFPSIKIGPGDSARSHTPNEFIYLDELKEGIKLYIQLLENLRLPKFK